MTNADTSLLGTWSLLRWEIAYDDGRPTTLPFGTQATGLIVYSSDGWMSACIAQGGRAALSSASVRQAPEAERLAAFESYFHYAGRYRLRQGEQGLQVLHEVTHSLNPGFVGSQQVREVHFDAQGVLTLSASERVPDASALRHHRLLWQRASA